MQPLSTPVQEAMTRVVQRFQTGDLSPIVELARLHPLQHLPSDEWTFSNRILAYVQAGTLDCRGYRQWQIVGRHVRQGARAVYIFAPLTRWVEDPDTGEEKPLIVGFNPVAVFPVHVTDGKPLPVVDYAPATLPPLSAVAADLGVRVDYLPLTPDRYGDCTLTGDSIRLGTHDEVVFFHELAHAAHARLQGKLKGGQQAEQEIVAEFTACVLAELYGVRDHTGNAWRYISRYHPNPFTAIVKALGTVSQVLALLTSVESTSASSDFGELGRAVESPVVATVPF